MSCPEEVLGGAISEEGRVEPVPWLLTPASGSPNPRRANTLVLKFILREPLLQPSIFGSTFTGLSLKILFSSQALLCLYSRPH